MKEDTITLLATMQIHLKMNALPLFEQCGFNNQYFNNQYVLIISYDNYSIVSEITVYLIVSDFSLCFKDEIVCHL